jgi:class 3 adenylate cyclase
VHVPPVERKLAAIFAADIAGYSRLMARDEVGTLARLKACRVIIDELIASHRGRIFNTAGDSVVADFASAVDAVQCWYEPDFRHASLRQSDAWLGILARIAGSNRDSLLEGSGFELSVPLGRATASNRLSSVREHRDPMASPAAKASRLTEVPRQDKSGYG